MKTSRFKSFVGKENQFISLNNSNLSKYNRLIAVNSNFLAIPTDNEGTIGILDSVSRNIKYKLKSVHGNFKDIEFSPFSKHLLCSSYVDNTILVWNLLEKNNILNKCEILYDEHKNPISYISFNSIVSDIICSISLNGELHIWNVSNGKNYIKWRTFYGPTCIGWNENCSLIGVTSSNNFITIFDPRKRGWILKRKINESFQTSKFVWLDNEKFITTGYDKNKNQQIKLWDINNIQKDIFTKVKNIKEDEFRNEIIPFIDRESKILFITEKNKRYMDIYDYSDDYLNAILNFHCSGLSLCSIIQDRKSLNFKNNEIDRFIRYTNENKIIYLSFYVEDNYFKENKIAYFVESGEPALNSEKWIKGENSTPIRKKLNNFIQLSFINKENSTIEKVNKEIRSNEIKIEQDISLLEEQLNKNEEIEKYTNHFIKKKNLYDSYIFDTEILSLNNAKIINLKDERGIIGRKFLKSTKKVGYYEIFENKELNLINNVSRNITFLHPPDNENDIYNKSIIIGFRYYKFGYQHIENYFTLINKYDNKFYILEKQNNKFYKKDLDCFDIIHNIIMNKYNNNIDIGESFPELIGFCYSLLDLKIKEFIFVEPYIPDIKIPDSLKEKLPDKLMENKTYVQPIIFNSHVTLLFSRIYDYNRINMLIDISGYHSKNKLDKFIFPLNMRNNLLYFPKTPFQMYNSCTLWIYGQIELIIDTNTKYNNFLDIYNNVKDKKLVYYIDVINLISNKFQNSSIFNIDEINDPQKLYYLYHIYLLAFDKLIIFNNMFGIEEILKFILSFPPNYPELKFIINCQDAIKEFLHFKQLLNINYNYIKCLKVNYSFNIEEMNDKCEKLLLNFKTKYFETFNEISEICMKKLLKCEDKNIQNKIKGIYTKKDFNNFKQINYNIFEEFKNGVEEIKDNFNEFKLYEQESITNFINSNNKMIFSLMTK